MCSVTRDQNIYVCTQLCTTTPLFGGPPNPPPSLGSNNNYNVHVCFCAYPSSHKVSVYTQHSSVNQEQTPPSKGRILGGAAITLIRIHVLVLMCVKATTPVYQQRSSLGRRHCRICCVVSGHTIRPVYIFRNRMHTALRTRLSRKWLINLICKSTEEWCNSNETPRDATQNKLLL